MRSGLTRSLSIRSRLLLYLICTAMVTAVAISSITALLVSRNARDRVTGQLESVATLKEQQVQSWIAGLSLNLDIVLSEETTIADLHTLTQTTPDSRAYSAAHERVQRHFAWAANRMDLFEEVFFMGLSGQVLVSTDRGHERQQLGLNDYFVQGRTGNFVQQPTYSLSLGRMTVVASRPAWHNGLSVGVLAGRASLQSLNEVMTGRAGLGETGETYLVASNHRLLTDLRRPGRTIPDTYIRTLGADTAVERNRNGSATYPGYAGDTVVGVYRWIPELRVGLIAEQGESEALRTTRLVLWTTGAVALAATLLAILAAIVLTRGIVRPLSDLGETAGRIAAGDLDLTARVDRGDEIGKLAQSFNRMTSQLRDLVRRLERRTQNLRSINEAGQHISSILDLDELLPYVAGSLLRTFDYESVRILLLAGDGSGRLLTCAHGGCEEAHDVRLEELDEPGMLAAVQSGAPVPPAWSAPGGERQDDGGPEGERQDGGGPEGERQDLAVPIRAGGKVTGVLAVTARPSHPLDEQDSFAAETLADQLAIAVENSRLYRQAHELAASKERQRLARDLHDAVSQTLFSVSLIAEVLPRIYDRDPEEGRRRLEELRQLTRGALAEMRTLLLELRPAALAEAELPDLLRQLGEAVVGRARIPVDVQTDVSLAVPADVRIALYRIAQEALNNVAKHSEADSASVRLSGSATGDQGEVELVVADDGAGFAMDDMGAGRLGLGIMQERAEAIGAGLEVDSRPGEGTRVRVVWRAEPAADTVAAGHPARPATV